MLQRLNNQEKLINYRKLGFTGGNNKDYDFTNFIPLRELFRASYYGEILIATAERQEDDFDDMTELLKNYRPRKNSKYYKLKDNFLINAQNFYDGRKMIIDAVKNKLFPLYSGNYYEEESPLESEKSSEDEMPEMILLNKLLN